MTINGINNDIKDYPNLFVMDAFGEVTASVFECLDLQSLGKVAQVSKRCNVFAKGALNKKWLSLGLENLRSRLQKRYTRTDFDTKYIYKHFITSRDDLFKKYAEFLDEYPGNQDDDKKNKFTVFFFNSNSPNPIQAYSVSHKECLRFDGFWMVNKAGNTRVTITGLSIKNFLKDAFFFCVPSEVRKLNLLEQGLQCPERFLCPTLFEQSCKAGYLTREDLLLEDSKMRIDYHGEQGEFFQAALEVHGIKMPCVPGMGGGSANFFPVEDFGAPEAEDTGNNNTISNDL